jgi:hypothetical protein
MNQEKQFMVEFMLPHVLNEEFMSLIPAQRVLVDQFLESGILASYAFSLEDSKLWAVFNAESELDVWDWIQELPLSEFMEANIFFLNSYNENPCPVPNFSLN